MSTISQAMPEAAAADRADRKRILLVLFLGVFMAALDAAVIAPTIPALRASFGVDNRAVSLVTIVFVLCSLSSNALMANLSDRYGRRPIYLMNVALFGLGSLVVALAPFLGSFGWLLVGRALQGVSAGGITPVAAAVIGDRFPAAERGKALGLIGATFGMAFVVGPLVASLIMLVASWQWIFLVNIPIAVVLFGAGMRVLPSTSQQQAHRFDLAGMLATATMLTALVLALNQVLDHLTGRLLWPFLLVLALIAGVVLVLVERRVERPIIPLALFARTQLRLAYTLSLAGGFGMGSVIFLATLASGAFAIPARQVGLYLIPLVICSSIGSVLAGRAQQRYGTRLILLVGFVALVLGYGLVGLAVSQFWLFLFATMVVGVGVGVVVGGALRAIVLNETSAENRSIAQSLINISSSVGNLLAAALIGVVADHGGGQAAGFGMAYLVVAGLILAAGMLVFGLKSRDQEHATV
ncbi:MAG: MFS transporter [Roseiflexaceae bacterium]